jgi:four helix bundle protein
MDRPDRQPIREFRDLEVYQRGYRLALEIHKESEGWPRDGRHGVTGQLRGAAWSVPANIAEGYGRKTFEKDFKRILVTALGSVNEATVFIDAARDLGWLDEVRHQEWRSEYDVLAKQLSVLIQNWKTY